LFLISACTPSTVQNKTLPIQEELVSQSHEKKPEWATKQAKEGNEEFLYFVGKSGKRSEETDALDRARSKAGKSFINYCGVEIQSFEEYLSVSSGRSSIARDVEKFEKTRIKQTSEGYFRGLQQVEVYSEYYRKRQGDHEIEKYWRVWVLVKVPRKEADAVKAWKQKREEMAESLLAQQLATAKQVAEEGNLFGALDQLHLLHSTAPKQPTPKRGAFIAQANGLESLWLESIQFDAVSAETQTVEPGVPFKPFEVKVELHLKEQRIPIRNFPVLFRMGSSLDIRRTNVDGIALVKIPVSSGVGEVFLKASPDPERLEKLVPQKALQSLTDQVVIFRIVVEIPFLKQRIKNDFPLMLASSAGNAFKAKQAVDISASCGGTRCRLQLWKWDGQSADLVYQTRGRERTARDDKVPLFKGIQFVEPTRFTLIALATSRQPFPPAKDGDTYPARKFESVLEIFRNMEGVLKAEEHLEITVQE